MRPVRTLNPSCMSHVSSNVVGQLYRLDEPDLRFDGVEEEHVEMQ